jgi:hypothetical protein
MTPPLPDNFPAAINKQLTIDFSCNLVLPYTSEQKNNL